MSVRIRGIYATALTALLGTDRDVVQASSAIDERFPDEEFPAAPAAVGVATSRDRRGVSLAGDLDPVVAVADSLGSVGRDALAWADPLPRGAVFAGEVRETLGRGAIVHLGEPAGPLGDGGLPPASRASEGFLPFDATDEQMEAGDRRIVQVREPRAPWADGRPELDATVRIEGGLLTLVRGEGGSASEPSLADVLPAEPAAGWTARWHDRSDDAGLDALGDALEAANERATAVDGALASAPVTSEAPPGPIHADAATAWVWFGRESRFALDGHRRDVTATMSGHHRVKAGDAAASVAVDFVEAICPDAGTASEDSESGDPDEGVPFGVLSDQFGPREGDRVDVGHGKPDGSRLELGRATVTDVDPEGTVTLEREMSPGGTYDGLGVDRRAGDVATTTVAEGRWWYPTVYRSDGGERRGTYVNVCTPVEVFPEEVRYVDLHVDVVKHRDGTVERVDDDELAAAEAAGLVPTALAEKARAVASAVERAL